MKKFKGISANNFFYTDFWNKAGSFLFIKKNIFFWATLILWGTFLVGCNNSRRVSDYYAPIEYEYEDENKETKESPLQPTQEVVPQRKMILPSREQSSEITRNPFLTRQENNFLQQQPLEEITYLEISGILYSPQKSYAIVNGRIVKEKDIVDNKEVIKIDREEIILQDAQKKKYVVKLKGIIDGS